VKVAVSCVVENGQHTDKYGHHRMEENDDVETASELFLKKTIPKSLTNKPA